MFIRYNVKSIITMKKIVLGLLFLFTINGLLYGQNQDDYRNHFSVLNFKWISAEAFQIQESAFLNLDNSLFYGRLSYNLPVYEIKTGGITIPIGLSYSSSGLRVDQDASDVGFGWSLNTGGNLTRIIKGGVMDNVLLESYDGRDDSYCKRGWNRWGEGFGAMPESTLSKLNIDDQAPDEFVLSALGSTDRFVYQEKTILPSKKNYLSLLGSNIDYEFRVNGDIYNLFVETENFKFRDYDKIIVRMPNGIQITFLPTEAAYTFNLMLSPSLSITKTNNYNSWGIKEILDINTGRKVTYNYSSFYKSNREIRLSNSSTITTLYKRRLNSISWSDGRVEFWYLKDREDKVFLEGTLEVKDKSLDQIFIYNANNEIVKQYDLLYSYFASGAIKKTYKDYRLRLSSVKQVPQGNEQIPPFEFQYHGESLPFPNIDSKEQDYWGFYNASGASTLMPKLYFYKKLVPLFSSSKMVNAYLPFIIPGLDRVELTKGVRRDPNEDACKQGMLKRVNLPTGGYQEFEYSLNEFSYYAEGMPSPQILKGGGLRIASQKISDGSQTRTLTYNYNAGGSCQGVISRFPSFGHYSPSGLLYSYENLDAKKLTDYTLISENSSYAPVIQDGSFVGYRIVQEIESGNGRKEFHFEVPTPLFDGFVLSYYRYKEGSLDKILESFNNPTRTSDNSFVFPDCKPIIGKVRKINYSNEQGQLLKSLTKKYIEKTKYSIPVKSMVYYGGVEPGFFYCSEFLLRDRFIAESEVHTIEGSGANYVETIDKLFYNDENLIEKRISYEPVDFNRSQQFSDLVVSSEERTYYDMDVAIQTEGVSPPYPTGYYTGLKSEQARFHQVVPVLQRRLTREGMDSDTYYHYVLPGGGRVLMDGIVTERTGDPLRYNQDIRVHRFDASGRPTLFERGNGSEREAVLWSGSGEYPLARVQNAQGGGGILFEGFEGVLGSPAGWNTSGSGARTVVGAARWSGSQSLRFSGATEAWSGVSSQAVVPVDPGRTYVLSCWYKAAPGKSAYINWYDATNGKSHTAVGSGTGRWEYLELRYTAPAADPKPCTGVRVYLYGHKSPGSDLYYDEVRFYPAGGAMETYSWRPGVGLTGRTDANGRPERYEYDGLGRLKAVYDYEGNIVKRYEYGYTGGASQQ